jgi:hypothetical protein
MLTAASVAAGLQEPAAGRSTGRDPASDGLKPNGAIAVATGPVKNGVPIEPITR